MDLLGNDLDGARILELYAGTGAVGLEALSRGAASCDFVENAGAAIHALRANVAALGVRKRTRIFDRDALRFAEALEPGRYDIVFADPPYGSRQLDRVVERWLERPYSAVLTVEHAADHILLVPERPVRFGDTSITTLRAE